MEICNAKREDIAETSAFAQRVFIEYYDDLIGHEQAVYMAELFLSQEAIGRLMDEGAVFRLVREGGKILAYYEYKPEADRMFLSKLYVDKDARGKGLGRMMFTDLLKETEKHGLNRIYLTVNKGNTPSYKIYLHLGFKVTDAVVNDIGHGYVMDDYIMEYRL